MLLCAASAIWHYGAAAVLAHRRHQPAVVCPGGLRTQSMYAVTVHQVKYTCHSSESLMCICLRRLGQAIYGKYKQGIWYRTLGCKGQTSDSRLRRESLRQANHLSQKNLKVAND